MRISSIAPFMVALFGVFAAGMALAADTTSALRQHDVDQPIDIAADQVEVRERNSTAIFNGKVKVAQGDLKLTSDRLEVFYEREKGESLTVLRLDAQGNVVLTSPSERVASEWGIYDVEQEIITMGGNVRLTRGETRLTGERLVLNLRTGLTTLDASTATPQQRVEGRFTLPAKKQPPAK